MLDRCMTVEVTMVVEGRNRSAYRPRWVWAPSVTVAICATNPNTVFLIIN